MKEAIRHIEGEIKNLHFRIIEEKQHLENAKHGVLEVAVKILSLQEERSSFKKALLKLKSK